MGLLDQFYRYGEPALGLISGAAAEPVAGWAGLLTGSPDNVAATRNALTYQPRTEQGQQGMNALANALMSAKTTMVDNNPPVNMLVNALRNGTDYVGERSPLAGALLTAAPAAAMSFLGPGSAVTRNAFGSVGNAGRGIIGEAMTNAGAVPAMRGPLSAQGGALKIGAPPDRWYHGTDATFDSFDLSKFGNGAFQNLTLGGEGRRPAVYLTNNKDHASLYGPNVLEVEGNFTSAHNKSAKPELKKWAKENGYKTAQEMIEDYYKGDAYDALNVDALLDSAVKEAIASGKGVATVDFGDLRHHGKPIGKISVVADPSLLKITGN